MRTPPVPGPPRTDRRGGQQGSSLIGTTAGVLVFLVFLTFVMQLLVGLHARSVVTGVAVDAAGAVAGAGVDHTDAVAVADAQDRATERLRRTLGRAGSSARVDWSATTDEDVVVRVEVDAPRFTIPGLGRPLITDHIDRTAVVRVEALR